MNQEMIEFLKNVLGQVIAGIPDILLIILTLVYYIKSLKSKVSEFPNRVKELKDTTIENAKQVKNEITTIVNAQLNDYKTMAQAFMTEIEAYKKKAEEEAKNMQALIMQNEIMMEVMKVFISQNDQMVVSGMGATAIAKISEYQERAYRAKEILKNIPQITDRAKFLAERLPPEMLDRLLNLPSEVLEEILNEYENKENKSQV